MDEGVELGIYVVQITIEGLLDALGNGNVKMAVNGETGLF